MAKKLTEAAVERMRGDPKRRIEVPDAMMPGLYLIIQPSGKKSWAVRFRWHGKPSKFTIGPYPAFGLGDARETARKVLNAVQRGEDPRALKRAAEADTCEAVIDEWIKRDQEGNRSVADVRRLMEREVIPIWRGRPISSITRRDALELIDGIADRGAMTYARRVHAHLHRLFRWSVGRGVLDTNPMSDLPKPGHENPRDRVLTDDELVRVWRAAEGLGYPFGPAFQLLILTGARREEIVSLRWSEVVSADGVIRLEGARTKNGKTHTIALSDPAQAILNDLPRVIVGEKESDLVFTTTGVSAASGISRAKKRLDQAAASIDADGKELDQPEVILNWRLHDLRRTVATGLQRLSCRLEVIEAVLGHLSGSRAGIVGIYQRHSYDSEKQQALNAWGSHVIGLVVGKPADNIVTLRAANNLVVTEGPTR